MFLHGSGSDAKGENSDEKVPKLSLGNGGEVAKVGQLWFQIMVLFRENLRL